MQTYYTGNPNLSYILSFQSKLFLVAHLQFWTSDQANSVAESPIVASSFSLQDLQWPVWLIFDELADASSHPCVTKEHGWSAKGCQQGLCHQPFASFYFLRPPRRLHQADANTACLSNGSKLSCSAEHAAWYELPNPLSHPWLVLLPTQLWLHLFLFQL